MKTKVIEDTRRMFECVTVHGGDWSVHTLHYKGDYVRVYLKYKAGPALEAIRDVDGRVGVASNSRRFPEYDPNHPEYGAGAWFTGVHAPPLSAMQEFFIRYLETEI